MHATNGKLGTPLMNSFVSYDDVKSLDISMNQNAEEEKLLGTPVVNLCKNGV